MPSPSIPIAVFPFKLFVVILGIGLESPHTTMFNMYYNGIKRMWRDGCAGIPNLKSLIIVFVLLLHFVLFIFSVFTLMIDGLCLLSFGCMQGSFLVLLAFLLLNYLKPCVCECNPFVIPEM